MDSTILLAVIGLFVTLIVGLLVAFLLYGKKVKPADAIFNSGMGYFLGGAGLSIFGLQSWGLLSFILAGSITTILILKFGSLSKRARH